MADNDFIGDGEVMSRDKLAKLLADKAKPAPAVQEETTPADVEADDAVIHVAGPIHYGDVSPRHYEEPVPTNKAPVRALFGPRNN